MTFDALGLSPEVLKAVAETGYTTPTPIQEQAIPYVLMGRDVLGCAQTGTGKTAGFTLPMIDILAAGRARARMPRSLILEPTRELAAQVAESFEVYGKYNKLSMALLIGGMSFDDQEKILDRGVDVLIATPGRLLDHFERGKVLLNDVRILVIDEADRMLDMGFIPDVERIVSLMPTIRQTLFFSATMPPEIRKLADAFLMNPKEVTVARPATTASTVQQGLAIVPGEDKREALRRLIRNEDVKNALIFCNRKKDVDILFQSLRKHGFSVGALHGDMSQAVRMETLERFKLGEIRLLVASDVAARGLDIDDLSHVFNFDAPFHPDDYVHRIGRTGRAGKAGIAYTLATPDDGGLVENIEKLIGKPIPRVEVPGFDAVDFDPEGGDGRRRGRGRGRGRPEPRGRGRGGEGRGRDERRSRRDQDRDGIDDLQPPAPMDVVADPPAAEAEAARPEGERPPRERRERRRGRDRDRDRPRDGGVTETGGYEGPTRARAGREDRPHDEAPRERRREREPRRDEQRRDEQRHEAMRPDDDRRERRRGRGRDRDDGPSVVGFGDSVPAFLAKPVAPRRRRTAAASTPSASEAIDADGAGG
ncbi:MAG: DEAD/DEAH box helicase [Alphaproteobacteria bacterium]|nr:DEAD/DEAH box helicase [Alphaproteobacteria bacterium]MCW5738533.1 DEAD/DEAH box helicase [Alphaproteobacteria bacterium]